jgi:hypothetical protein
MDRNAQIEQFCRANDLIQALSEFIADHPHPAQTGTDWHGVRVAILELSEYSRTLQAQVLGQDRENRIADCPK